MPEDHLHRFPKIDLHRHVDGSIRPSTILELGREYGLLLPTFDLEELACCVRVRKGGSLLAFFEPWNLFKLCFVNRDAVARIVYEMIEDAGRDHVRYLEIRFCPEFMAWHHGLRLEEVAEGMVAGREAAAERFPVETRLIVTLSRQSDAREWAAREEVAELAIAYRDRGVVAFGLSGIEDEGLYPARSFRGVVDRAREAGLGITVHAGESDGPESVRACLEWLSPDRIGHGVRIVEDPKLIDVVRDRGIPLEMCPTSNVLTGATASLASHPMRRFYDVGIPVTINTDDPVPCGTTLTEEYRLAMETFGFGKSDLWRMLCNALEGAFLPSGKRKRLEEELTRGWTE